MFNKKEKKELLKQYNNMCMKYNKTFEKLRECTSKGDYEEAEKQKQSLRYINRIIINLQKRLDSFSYIHNYKRDEGYNLNLITEKIDELTETYIEHAQGMKREDGSNEYRNDGMVDERKVPKEDARRAAEAWGEGYEPLINFLETCIENGFQTYACCAGHEEGDLSYVLFSGTDENALDLVEFLAENKMTERIALTKDIDTGKVFLCITSPMDEREDFYNKCSEFIKKEREEEKKENLIGKVAMMMEEDEQINEIEYYIRQGYFTILLDDGNYVKYTSEDLYKKIQEDPSGKSIKTRRPVIDRVKEMCKGLDIGLHDVMATRRILESGQKDITKENDKERVEE